MRLEELYQKHQGRAGVIVANGPSLRIDALGSASDFVSFGFNRVFLNFPISPWRPDYYLVCDRLVAEDNRLEIEALNLQKIFAHSTKDALSACKDAYFVDAPRHSPAAKHFETRLKSLFGMKKRFEIGLDVPLSWRLTEGVKAGHSVVNFALKAAFWMGIRHVVVVGLDHRFDVTSVPNGEVVYGAEVLISDGENNHFIPGYRRKGERWTRPQLPEMELDFLESRRVYETHGGSIINGLPTSEFEGWEKMDLHDAFREARSRL